MFRSTMISSLTGLLSNSRVRSLEADLVTQDSEITELQEHRKILLREIHLLRDGKGGLQEAWITVSELRDQVKQLKIQRDLAVGEKNELTTCAADQYERIRKLQLRCRADVDALTESRKEVPQPIMLSEGQKWDILDKVYDLVHSTSLKHKLDYDDADDVYYCPYCDCCDSKGEPHDEGCLFRFLQRLKTILNPQVGAACEGRFTQRYADLQEFKKLSEDLQNRLDLANAALSQRGDTIAHLQDKLSVLSVAMGGIELLAAPDPNTPQAGVTRIQIQTIVLRMRQGLEKVRQKYKK